jgi:hypothetical protein
MSKVIKLKPDYINPKFENLVEVLKEENTASCWVNPVFEDYSEEGMFIMISIELEDFMSFTIPDNFQMIGLEKTSNYHILVEYKIKSQ